MGWYVVAADYDYSALSGTYTFGGQGVISAVTLNPDRTFSQERTEAGHVMHTTGTWRRIGEGGVAFSADFLRLPGQQSYGDKFGYDPKSTTNDDFGGSFRKILTVYPELLLDGVPDNLVLHKKLFR